MVPFSISSRIRLSERIMNNLDLKLNFVAVGQNNPDFLFHADFFSTDN
jgi:hypothetical protein